MKSKAVGNQYLYDGEVVTVLEMFRGSVYFRNCLFGDSKRRKLPTYLLSNGIRVKFKQLQRIQS